MQLPNREKVRGKIESQKKSEASVFDRLIENKTTMYGALILSLLVHAEIFIGSTGVKELLGRPMTKLAGDVLDKTEFNEKIRRDLMKSLTHRENTDMIKLSDFMFSAEELRINELADTEKKVC